MATKKASTALMPPPTAPAAATALSEGEQKRRGDFMSRIFGATVQAAELQSVYIGSKLGYYAALRDFGPLDSRRLAERTRTAERYAREWLEQQAVAGILDVAQDAPASSRRTFRLPAGHAEVLLEPESLNYLAFLPRYPVSTAQQLPAILKAFRTGAGVAWGDYGPDVREAQAEQNRAFFFHQFAPQLLPQIAAVDRRLRADPPARVADVACGAGWCAIALAQAYPKVRVDGFDLDHAAIRMAKASAKAYGVADRVRFHARDAATPSGSEGYDLVTIVEALHDMSQPVAVLKAMRRRLAPGGSVLVVDENVAESFTAPGSDMERLFYCFSILACLPNGLADRPSAATGTVMRPATLERYAREAGFRKVEVLPLQHDFFRFYRLSG